MSEAQSAQPGASFDGIARIAEAGPVGMVSLRGDLGSAAVKRAVKTATDAALPGRRAITRAGDFAVLWMSPDELLVLCPADKAGHVEMSLSKSLSGKHFLAMDVSDARAVFDVSGAAARDVLAKLFPVDLAPAAFAPGMVRRSRMAQVPAALWMEAEERFRVIVFRSVARYAFDLLRTAAAEGGEVGLHG